jgi:hypothetical protein
MVDQFDGGSLGGLGQPAGTWANCARTVGRYGVDGTKRRERHWESRDRRDVFLTPQRCQIRRTAARKRSVCPQVSQVQVSCPQVSLSPGFPGFPEARDDAPKRCAGEAAREETAEVVPKSVSFDRPYLQADM